MAIKYKATDPATVRQEDRPAQIQRVKEEYEQAKTAGTAAGAKTSAASGSPLNRDVRDAQVRQAWASRPATERFAPATSATGPAKAVPRPTTVQRLNALSNRIGQREQQLTNMGLQLNQLETAYNAGDYSAVDKYNALANQYNTVFNQYVADVDSYNKLYRGEYRDQGIRNNYARSQYGQAVKAERQATRDQGSRQLYEQRRQEEALRVPQLTTIGKENEQVVERTPNRVERVIGAGLSGTASGFTTAAGLTLNNQFDEHDSRTLRRKGASVGEHSYKRISGEEPREAGFTYAVSPAYQQRMARAKLTADGLIDTGRKLNTRSNMQTDIAKEGLGETGQMLVDLGVMAVQMAADIGIAAATGGSMLVPLGIRSYGNGYLTAEQMGYTGDAAQSYALGVAAVEVLSEKMFSVFGIVNKFARGAVTQEMSERVIDGLVKRLASSPGGRTALNRLFTILFSAGSEGLEEVVAGIMEPLIRKYTLDRDVKALKEIDWQETLYEGLLGGILGGLGGAVDLTNTRPTYWKYYKEGIDESIGRYEAAVKKYGLDSKEAQQAAKEVWDGGNRKMNAVAGFIVDANEDGEGGTYVPIQKATTEDLEKGLPVTYHQLAAAEETTRYGRTDAEGNPVQGPSIADSLYLGKYLQNEEKIRRQEAARREEAARLEAEEKARVATEKPAQTATEGETVRLDTARSAQNRTDVNNVTPAPAIGQPAAKPTTQGIPAEEMTQEEKDELQYGSGAVEDLGQYTGLAQRMGAPVAGRSSARVASSPAANVARTGNEDITRRVNELAGRLQSKGLQSVERIKADPRMDGMRVGDVIFINERLSGAAAEAATMGHEVVHFAGDFDAQLINDLIAAMRRQGRDIDGLVETKREIYRKQFAEMGQAWDEEQMNQAYFEEEVAADFIGEICRADSETLDRIAAEEPGLIRRIINALRNMLARITGNQQAVYEQAIDRLNAALEKAGRNENAVRTDDGVRYAFAGENAREADVQALEDAQRMEEQGVAAETIFRETGWFKGMDGKWRFEIDDSGMEYSSKGDLNFRKDHPDYSRYRELLDKANRFALGLGDADLTKEEREEFDQLKNIWSDTFWQPGRITPDALPMDRLSDYVRHEELFDNYPELRDATVIFKDLPRGDHGSYNRATNTITLSDAIRNAPEETIVHEVQHAIQAIEGFASGSNPDYWKSSTAADARTEAVRSIRKEIDILRGMLPNDEEDAAYIRGGIENLEKQLDDISFFLYQNTAGEIEARDAASRRDLTEEQRRETMPDAADEYTVFAQGADPFSSTGEYDEETAGIKKQILNNQDELNKMDPVADIVVPENLKGKNEATLWAIEELKPTGYKVDRPGYGIIEFSRKDIRYGLNYANTPAEKAAILALPKLLKRGKEISEHKNHDNRKKQTITIAAPVVLNGIRGNMAAVVNRHGSHYYAHRILMPDGTVFTFSKEQQKKEVTPRPSRGVAESSSLAKTIGTTSNKNITEESRTVNSESDLKTTIQQLANRVAKLADKLEEQEPKKQSGGSASRSRRRSPDVRFSLAEPVEEQGSLVALHNLDATKLGKALDLGGFPMPSIAVTKADIPHTNFGDITLVMDKSTVDPAADRRNEVYSADAWTPTFPQTEYEADEKVQSRLRRKFYDMQKQFGRDKVDALYGYGNYLEDEMNRYGGVAGILERERDNDRMKQVYMLDAGLELPEPGTKKTTTRMDDASIAMNEYFLQALGESTVREITPQDEESPMTARKRWWGDHGEEMEEAYRGYLRQPQFGLSEDEIGNVMDQMRVADFTRMVLQARHYLNNGPETVKEEPDYTARDKAIANVDHAAYEEWLEELFAGAEKNSGIYNGKDRYTASGNQRSFASTHYDVTLENIARAMAAENDGNSKNVGGFYGVKTLRGGTAVTFRSIPEMHELEDRLQHLTEEEAEQLNEALQNRLIEVLGKIDGQRSYGSSEDNAFMRMDSIGYIMEEIAETGSWPAEKVQRIFGKYSYDLSPEIGQEVSDLLTDIQQMPVNIFEAKPKRAVRFDEVRAAIVPDSTDQALIDRLHEAGVEDVRTYEDGNDASRLAEVNAVPNVRFSLNDDPELERARQQAEYWKQLALKNSGVKDVDKLTRDLMRGYGSRASRSEMSGRMRELEEFLRSGGSEAEARATARQMAEDMLNKAAVPEDAADSEYHAAFRRYFRTNSISVPEEVKRGWPDGWGRFRKRYFGRLNLKNDGMDVTKIYREASQQWPDLLPSDEVVMRAQDQLETIAEVLDNLEPNMVNPYGSGPEFDAAVDSLAEDIISSLTRTEEAKGTAREEARRERIDRSIDELENREEQQQRFIDDPAELIAASRAAKQKQQQAQKIMRTLRLNQQESKLVDSLLSGALTVDQLPDGIDRRGVLQAYRAKVAVREAQAPVDEYNARRRDKLDQDAADLTEHSDEWKDRKSRFGYDRETARRNFQDIAGAAAGAMIDTYVQPIREHEAEKTRMVSRYNDRIKKLKLDTKTRHGNKVSEAYAVQYVGEAEFIRDWLEQMPEGAERGGVTYHEAMTMLDEFWRENPNLDKDRIHAAVAEFRSVYDELFAMINEARVVNGYAPIDYRKGYFPHFTSDSADNIIQSLANGLGFGVEVTELPTDIAGTTHLFRPGIQWSGHMLRRTGNETDYNALEGWDRYIPAVANIIYHTEDIQRLRALERTLRHKYSDKTVQDEIERTRNSRDLTETQKNSILDELFKRDVTHLNYFVQWLREYTNQLAGKRADLDRVAEAEAGRKLYRIVQKFENRVAANMLGGNISSAMTNFVPLFQAWGNVSTGSMIRAMWDTTAGAVKHDGFRDSSDFLVNRKGYDPIYQTLFDKTKNGLFMPFNIVDDFVSETIVRARYYDELKRGHSPAVALMEADTFAGGVMADRAVGELPVIFNSKNPFVKVFTMFQVEVNNDLSHFFKDVPRDVKERGIKAVFWAILKYVLGVHIFNDLFEALFGRRVSFDPLEMLNNLVGDATGYELPNGFELSAELIRTGQWPGWEAFENGKGDDFFGDLLGKDGDLVSWLDDLPFISGLLGGGRFPILSALPDQEQFSAGLQAFADLVKRDDVQENSNAYDLNKMYKAARAPLAYFLPPAFGGQARKIAEGLYAASQGGSYTITTEGDRRLQYPVEGVMDIIKASVFGKTATKGGKKWIESDFDTLSVDQTEAYLDLVTGGSDPQFIYDVLHDLKGTERSGVEKAYALAAVDLKDSERIRLLDALVSESQSEKFAAMMGGGLTFRQCAEVYEEYKVLDKKGELKDADGSYVYKKNQLATEFSAWIDEAGYSEEQKEVITEQYKFWNMVPAKAGNYEKFTAAGLSIDSALELSDDWSELKALPGSTYVSDAQKIGAVAAAGYLSEKEKQNVVRSMMDDEKNADGVSQQTKFDQYIVGYQVPVECYSRYLTQSNGLKGDDLDGDGKTDSGSLAKKKLAVIDRLPLQPGQKTALALFATGNAESTIRKYAPWL